MEPASPAPESPWDLGCAPPAQRDGDTRVSSPPSNPALIKLEFKPNTEHFNPLGLWNSSTLGTHRLVWGPALLGKKWPQEGTGRSHRG